MFQDRSDRYDFSKIDKNARTQTLIEQESEKACKSDAHRTLFSAKLTKEKPKDNRDILNRERKSNQSQNVVQNTEIPVLNKQHDLNISNLPSSNYLNSFANKTIDMEESLNETETSTDYNTIKSTEEKSDINYNNLIEEASKINIDSNKIKKELNNTANQTKKSYSFRIKLIAGVYCILVALFGGWVIGNAIDITHLNGNLYKSTYEYEQINQSITDIILKIKSYDNASEEDSILVDMTSEIIPVTPIPIEEPVEYEQESNWFDAFCNWISNIFGRK